jgi:acyl carrier protein
MTLETFLEKLKLEFDDLNPESLTFDSSFKDIEQWSSMHALILIAFLNTEFDVILSGEELRGLSTIRELYNVVCKKLPDVTI